MFHLTLSIIIVNLTIVISIDYAPILSLPPTRPSLDPFPIRLVLISIFISILQLKL
jgi:hypothetical protein